MLTLHLAAEAYHDIRIARHHLQEYFHLEYQPLIEQPPRRPLHCQSVKEKSNEKISKCDNECSDANACKLVPIQIDSACNGHLQWHLCNLNRFMINSNFISIWHEQISIQNRSNDDKSEELNNKNFEAAQDKIAVAPCDSVIALSMPSINTFNSFWLSHRPNQLKCWLNTKFHLN